MAGGDNVEVSWAQLPQSLLLGQVGGCGCRFLGLEDPCSQGTSSLRLRPNSLEAYYYLIVSISSLF
jgi:hypothetical protein